MKLTNNIIERISELAVQKYIFKKDIPAIIEKEFGVKISRTSVFNICKDLHIPQVEEEQEKKNKTIAKITDLISLRLLYFCDDLELLAKRFASEVCYQETEKIIISEKITNIIPQEKINKIIYISHKAGLNFDVEYKQGAIS